MSKNKEQTVKEERKKEDNLIKKTGYALGKLLANIIIVLLIIVLDVAFVYGFDNADIRLFFKNRHQKSQLSDKVEMYYDITSAEELIRSGVIQEGIKIDEVDVGGMKYDKAVQVYTEYIKNAGQRTIRLDDSVGYFSSDFAELGIEVDVDSAVKSAITYGHRGNVLRRYKNKISLENDVVDLVSPKTIDENVLRSLLQKEAEHMEKDPVDASITRKGDDFVINPSEKGIKVDTEETIAQINKELEKCWSSSSMRVEVSTDLIDPELTEENFEGVDSILGRATTQYNSSNSERAANLAVGASKIADSFLMPGEQFSVYNTVAPFTEENGYKNAGQYINAELTDGLGGGICQVATTLYDAVLEAELQVDERYPHSMTVSYVNKGMDAAIAEGYEDFKFTNNTDNVIYIDAYAGGGFISVVIYGHETRSKTRQIEFESLVLQTFSPGGERTIYDDKLPKGTTNVTQAHTGYYVELWKHVYENGEEIETVKINGSQYSAVPRTTRIGTMIE